MFSRKHGSQPDLLKGRKDRKGKNIFAYKQARMVKLLEDEKDIQNAFVFLLILLNCFILLIIRPLIILSNLPATVMRPV